MRHHPVMNVQDAVCCGGRVVVEACCNGTGESGETSCAKGDVSAVVNCLVEGVLGEK